MATTSNNKKNQEGGKMRSRHLGVILFAALICGLAFVPVLSAQATDYNDQDSLWVNFTGQTQSEENKQLILSFTWETYIKKYNPKNKTYKSDWEKYEKSDEIAYRVTIYTDTAMTKTVKSMDVQTKEVTFRELSFGVEYWVKGEPVGVPNPVKFAKADGKIFQSSSGGDKEGKGGFLRGFWAFSKSGGILIPFMYLFGLFGFLVCWPVTWWKARLANIFPPNKPGFIYTFLPFDRTGKSDFLTDKGNAYIREITKYWGKAMEAQNIKPSLWKDEEDFIKSDQQSQEEMRKKLWLKVGLPNIEKAIDICKNGVPGIKLEKKPLEYPFARVMLAVLENHRSNKNAWWASQEMDRAMGNTAVKELGNISGWTVMALWALGSIEPMLGLFGTVIGIRQSFIKITDTIKENPNTELTVIVPQLAGGIHVALITTIVGLALGTPFTVLHYYYKGKIDWIAGKWEEIIIDVLNRA